MTNEELAEIIGGAVAKAVEPLQAKINEMEAKQVAKEQDEAAAQAAFGVPKTGNVGGNTAVDASIKAWAQSKQSN